MMLAPSVFRYLPTGRGGLAVIFAAATGVVVLSVVMTEMLRLSPCPLCIFQRLNYMVIGVAALLGMALPGRRWWAGGILLLSLGGLGTALYQSWMQAFPELVKECSFTDPSLIEQLVDWLGMRFPQLFLATGFCTSKEWVFLGLSIANWSVLVFAALGLLAWGVARPKAG